MHCPRLLELPQTLDGKNGWPWTEETVPAELEQTSGSLPSISVVTPSYNQAAFLEETIRSVLLQGYPNLEYLVMDGGSSDGSVEIIKKYEKYLAYWTSQKDAGPSDAIRKGFEKATGSILAYLNSDDLYLPGTLHHLVNRLRTTGALTQHYGDGGQRQNGSNSCHARRSARYPAHRVKNGIASR